MDNERKWHPAACIFPMPDEAAINSLAEDIAENGLEMPIIVMPDGSILDGRCRNLACQIAGVEPHADVYHGDDPVGYSLSLNLHRRHLSSSQSAMVAAKAEDVLASLAEEARQNKGGRPSKHAQELPQKIGEVLEDKHEREAVAKAAKLFGTNRTYVNQAKKLIDEAPDLAEQVERGELKIAQAASRLKKRQVEDAAKMTTSSEGVSKINPEVRWKFLQGACESIPLDDNSVDLVFCSPPYESQRSYGETGFDKVGDDYVTWAVECFLECLRVCRGAVCWVIEGATSDYRYSATPFLLMTRLHERGVHLRKPCVYQRQGIPGTGGPDWLRNDWEPIICATKGGKLPWSDNTAMGHPPVIRGDRKATNRTRDGSRKSTTYKDPEVCNPGNIISGRVGSGNLGWSDAHENEAPFPQWLADFFVRSFCPPGGTVLDPFSGSGTTVAAAVKNGRNAIGIDIRQDQVWLGETRLLGLSVTERRAGGRVLV